MEALKFIGADAQANILSKAIEVRETELKLKKIIDINYYLASREYNWQYDRGYGNKVHEQKLKEIKKDMKN